DCLSQRTLAVERNLVVRKRIPLIVAPARSCRIVQGYRDTLTVDQSAEIAVPHCHGRHRHQLIRCPPDRKALVGEKEKRAGCTVIDFGDNDRTAYRSAEFVADQMRRLEIGRILSHSSDTNRIVSMGLEQ